MKKNGFTLAEVLITLTIIGVVAVLTLPALLTNTQEQQAKTALRKMTSTMTNIAAMSVAIDGVDYTGITAASVAGNIQPTEDVPSLLNMFANRATINRDNTVIQPAAFPATVGPAGSYAAPNMRAIFNDGTCVYFNSAAVNTAAPVATTQRDGLHRGFLVVFDTNGLKGPNQISHCTGSAPLANATFASDDNGNCTNRQNRFLRDRYIMALRGTKVDPIGAASSYVLTDATGPVNDAYKSTGQAAADNR